MKPRGRIELVVSRRGQITLPADVRGRLGIKQGDVVTLEETPGEIVVRPGTGARDGCLFRSGRGAMDE